jgi:hypothetical protein
MFMTLAGFIILLLIGLLAIWLYVEIAQFPGKKARERNHPQADAINVLGWIGPLLGGVGWVVALVWAYTKPIVAIIQSDATSQQIGEAVKEALEKERALQAAAAEGEEP